VPKVGFDPRFVHTAQCSKTALSDAGFDLLTKLLCLHAEARITASAALRHPWFREAPLPQKVPEEQLAKLRQEYNEGAKAAVAAAEAKKAAAAAEAQRAQVQAVVDQQRRAQLLAAQRMAAMMTMGMNQWQGFPG
jgi:hypothetical protein